MTRLPLMWTLLLLAVPLSAQQSQSVPTAKSGYVHCDDPRDLIAQDRVLQLKGIRAWHAWMVETEACHLGSGDAPVTTRPAGEIDGRPMLCILSPMLWEGCEYAFSDSVYWPQE